MLLRKSRGNDPRLQLLFSELLQLSVPLQVYYFKRAQVLFIPQLTEGAKLGPQVPLVVGPR